MASSFDQDGLPGAVARDLSQVGYRYDGVGNRRDVSKTTTSVGVLAESYGVNALNQYTSIAAGATPAVVRDHDDNGNLTDDGSKLFTFDYKNRLVGAQRKSDSAPIALYSYLADGRRVRKQVWNPDGGALVRDTRFVLDGAQEVEEQDWSSGATTTTYVWSPVYVDELVEFTNASGSHFAHQDARCDVVAVTNAAGAVVERRRFDDFGRVEVRDAGGAVVAASPSGLEYGFQGRRLDPETGLVFFRARYYSPETGRFVQRDPVWDAGNVGGQYTFCGNGPGSRRDPGGTQGEDEVLDTVRKSLERFRDVERANPDIFGKTHNIDEQVKKIIAEQERRAALRAGAGVAGRTGTAAAEGNAVRGGVAAAESTGSKVLKFVGGKILLPAAVAWTLYEIISDVDKAFRDQAAEDEAAHREQLDLELQQLNRMVHFGYNKPQRPACHGPLSPAKVNQYIEDLRNGNDVRVKNIAEARQLLDAMPELRPHVQSGQRLGVPYNTATADTPAGFESHAGGTLMHDLWEQPYNTYRGDLLGHPGGTSTHAQVPHYNIRFGEGTRGAAILIGDPP